MEWLTVHCAFLTTLFAVVSCQCQVGWMSFEGNCYHVSPSAMTAHAGRAYCRQHKSYLADIQSQVENDFVVNLALANASSSYLLIGLNDEQTEGVWVWPRTNASAAYTNWGSGEPGTPGSAGAGVEDCVQMQLTAGAGRGGWHDVGCGNTHSVLCKQGPDIVVTCNTNTMGYTVRKDYLGYQSAIGLSLTDSSCQPSDAGGDSFAQSWTLGTCGTAVSQVANKTIYTNTLKFSEGSLSVITRENDYKLTVSCSFDSHGKVTSGALQPGFEKKVNSVDGFGTYTVRLDVTDSTYNNPITSFPHQVELEDNVHFRLTVQSTASNLDIFAVRCYATPLASATSSPQYDILKEDCAVDPTTFINSSVSTDTMRFGMQAFKFLGSYQYVYTHCEVVVCHPTQPGNRCAQGCLSGAGRKRRQTGQFAGASSIQTLSQGPFTRASASIDTSTTQEGPNSGTSAPVHLTAFQAVILAIATVVLTVFGL